MGISPYSLEQRFEFIKDCYKSGLSIPAWCHNNNIAPGTFYGWIKQVTSHGYEIPDSLNYHPDVKRQEVVKLPVIDDICADSYMNRFSIINDTDADKPLVLSAHIGGITLDIPQDIDQDFPFLIKFLNLSRSAYDWRYFRRNCNLYHHRENRYAQIY